MRVVQAVRSFWLEFRGWSPHLQLWFVTDIAGGLALGVYGLLFNLHLLDAGFNAGHIGSLDAAGAATVMLASVPAGLLADRWSLMGAFRIGILTALAGSLALPWVTDFRGLLLLRIALFAAASLAAATELPIITSHLEPEQRTRVYSLMTMNVLFWTGAGTLLGGLLSRLMPAGPASPHQWSLTLAGALLALAAIARLWVRPAPLPGEQRRFQLLPSPAVLKLALVGVLAAASGALPAGFANVIFRQRYGIDPDLMSVLFIAGGWIGWTATWLAPRLTRRLGAGGGVLAIRAAKFPILVAAAFVPGLIPFLAVYWLWAATTNIISPVGNAFAMEIALPKERATMVAYQVVGANLGTAIASKYYGEVLARGGYGHSFLVSAALAALAAALFYVLFRRQT